MRVEKFPRLELESIVGNKIEAENSQKPRIAMRSRIREPESKKQKVRVRAGTRNRIDMEIKFGAGI